MDTNNTQKFGSLTASKRNSSVFTNIGGVEVMVFRQGSLDLNIAQKIPFVHEDLRNAIRWLQVN